MTITATVSPPARMTLWPGAIATGTYALLLLLVGSFVDTPFKQSGAGEWRLTTGGHGLVDLLAAVGFAVVSVAVVFGLAVRSGLAQAAPQTALRALVLAVAGVATVVVFWTGLPVVLAGGATVLALDTRARSQRLPATAVIAIGIASVLVLVATWLAFTG